MLQKPRGTRDFLPAEMAQRRSIERRMRDVAAKLDMLDEEKLKSSSA
ncbi:MAG: hypothetical protein LBL85_04290 [Methanocalculaceae archaeon]|jgi:histidyl-tRNA synthetase|nr:hypothetical protein [Methanocalculaceae archaeon]